MKMSTLGSLGGKTDDLLCHPLGGKAVAVTGGGDAELFSCGLVGKQFDCILNHAVGICSDDAERGCISPFASLTHNQGGDAQKRRFLLESAAVGDEQGEAGEEMGADGIGQGRQNPKSGEFSELLRDSV